MKSWVVRVITVGFLQVFMTTSLASKTCSYSSYRWNTVTKKAEDFITIDKPYSELLPEEVDATTGCSVCVEDQRWIQVAELRPVRLCKVIAHEIEWILNRVLVQGFPVSELTGYRVGAPAVMSMAKVSALVLVIIPLA